MNSGGRTLRVCIDARLGSGKSGGVEQFVIGLAGGLSRLEDGDEEFLLLTHEGEDEWLLPYIAGRARILYTRHSKLNRRTRAATRALLERAPRIGTRFAPRPSDGTIEREQVEVVHFPFQDAFTTSVPSIYQPHDLQHLHLRSLFPHWQVARREVIYRTHCRQASTVVSMTSWGKRDLIEHYDLDPAKVAVVPGGSVLEEYPEPSRRDLAQLRSRLSLPDRILLYPAQTWPHKNHARLLEGIARARQDGAEVVVVCPGRKTDHFAAIEAKRRELGLESALLFPGFVSPVEMRALYEMAAGLVFPSLFEGWGLPICEAWSAGVPVASSTATGLPDLVADAGILFDAEDPAAIADAVTRLWRDGDLRAELIRKGNERSRGFSFDHTARLFRAHYRRIGERQLTEEDRNLLDAPPPA